MGRRHGVVETNLLRSHLIDPCGDALPNSAPVTARTLLGMEPSRVSRQLSVRDLAVLAWCGAKIPAEGDPVAEGTLYELGRAIYRTPDRPDGREPGGRDRKQLLESLRRIAECTVSLPGYDAVRRKQVGKVTGSSLANLVDAIYIEHELIGNAKTIAGLRGNNLRIRLTVWLATQIREGFATYLDLAMLRSLGTGLAGRLWAFLESEDYKRTGKAMEGKAIGLGRPALASLGVSGYSRHIDARRALNRAGRRICEADLSYAEIRCERRPGGWALVARRRRAESLEEARKARREIVRSLGGTAAA